MRAHLFRRSIALAAILALLVTSVTSAAVWTDQDDYPPGSVVTISGDNSNDAGYLAGETVVVEVSGPNGYAASCEAATDDEGAWSCQITLWDSALAEGDYAYAATGLTSGVSESGTFTDHGQSPVTSSGFSITANATFLVTVSVTLGGGSSEVTLTKAEANIDGLTGDLNLTGPGGNGNGTWTGSFQGSCETTYKINNIKVTWKTAHDHQSTETPGPPQPQVTTGACPPADNQPPEVLNIQPSVVPANTTFNITATIDDTNRGNSNIVSADYSLDNGTSWAPMTAVDSIFNSPVEDVTATVAGGVAVGVYDLCVRGTDAANNTGVECILLAVYDPSAGFVTGGGWIWSPAGAYVLDENLEGKANFGFVSRYQKGKTVPSGHTEFHLNAAGFSFKSGTYDWLVVAGKRAQFKGDGSVNGVAGYGFMLTAIDGSPDKFRIKIWESSSGDIVYDNQMGMSDSGNAATDLGGGSIVIHTGK